MTQLAIISDLAAHRKEAGRKAAETRRARLQNGVYPVAVLKKHNGIQLKPSKLLLSHALAAFELEAQSDAPDWHRVALTLKQALTAPPALTQKSARPAALPPPVWADYPVDHLGSFKVRNPTIVVTFANGEVVRAPAVSAKNKPVNIGRGLRVAIAYCQSRLAGRSGYSLLSKRRRPAVPAITACVCEDTGERYDAEQCTLRTVEARREGRRLNRHDRRREKLHV